MLDNLKVSDLSSQEDVVQWAGIENISTDIDLAEKVMDLVLDRVRLACPWCECLEGS